MVLGALMMLGIGFYGPCLIMISLLGMDPRVSYPIMMGACAFLMPSGSIQFIRKGSYDLRTAIAFLIAGPLAVLIAAPLVDADSTLLFADPGPGRGALHRDPDADLGRAGEGRRTGDGLTGKAWSQALPGLSPVRPSTLSRNRDGRCRRRADVIRRAVGDRDDHRFRCFRVGVRNRQSQTRSAVAGARRKRHRHRQGPDNRCRSSRCRATVNVTVSGAAVLPVRGNRNVPSVPGGFRRRRIERRHAHERRVGVGDRHRRRRRRAELVGCDAWSASGSRSRDLRSSDRPAASRPRPQSPGRPGTSPSTARS